MENEQVKFEGYAIVELMGRSVIAGYVSEQVIGGAPMLRVDVPTTSQQAGYTKFYGGTAIYAITPTDEATVKVAVGNLRPRPVESWIVPSGKPEKRLVDSRADNHDFEDDEEDEEDYIWQNASAD